MPVTSVDKILFKEIPTAYNESEMYSLVRKFEKPETYSLGCFVGRNTFHFLRETNDYPVAIDDFDQKIETYLNRFDGRITQWPDVTIPNIRPAANMAAMRTSYFSCLGYAYKANPSPYSLSKQSSRLLRTLKEKVEATPVKPDILGFIWRRLWRLLLCLLFAGLAYGCYLLQKSTVAAAAGDEFFTSILSIGLGLLCWGGLILFGILTIVFFFRCFIPTGKTSDRAFAIREMKKAYTEALRYLRLRQLWAEAVYHNPNHTYPFLEAYARELERIVEPVKNLLPY